MTKLVKTGSAQKANSPVNFDQKATMLQMIHATVLHQLTMCICQLLLW